MSKKEIRHFPIQEIRVERGVDGAGDKFIGYAAMFNKTSKDLGGFREKIEPGAFKKSIRRKDDVRALFNHNNDFVLGRTTSGTLKLKEDDDGLRMENTPPDTTWAKDLKVSVDRGDVTKMSFGFRTVSDLWETVDGKEIRTLKEVDLYDVSIVTNPAYDDTSVALRSLDEWREENKDDPSDPTIDKDKTETPEPTHRKDSQARERELELKRKNSILEDQ